MAAILAGTVAGLPLCTALIVTDYLRRQQVQAWSEAAHANGLCDARAARGDPFALPTLEGRIGRIGVRMTFRWSGRDGVVIVTTLPQRAARLSIRLQTHTTRDSRFSAVREIEIGDAEFDESCYVEAPAPLAFALLVPTTRRRLLALLRGRIRVEHGPEVLADVSLQGGVLEVRLREGRYSRNRAHLTGILAVVLDVAERLVPPVDDADRIAGNLTREEEPGVRLRTLRVLAREYPRHAATRGALLGACKDPSDEVRFVAANALGAEGLQTLFDLARDVRTSDAVAAGALSTLADAVSGEFAEAVLAGALGEIEQASHHRGDLLVAPTRPQTACRCLEALARLGRVEAQHLLLMALRSPDPDVTLAATRALGGIGTAAAVMPLREQIELHGDLLRSDGRQAIAAIQSRLSGAATGQLSLVANESGALSFPQGEPGDLTLAEADETDAGEPPAR